MALLSRSLQGRVRSGAVLGEIDLGDRVARIDACHDGWKLREAFEGLHEERYGYRDEEQALELVTIRVTATARAVEVELAGDADLPEPERGTRRATLDGEEIELEVLRGIPAPDARMSGPAVVELPESTLLIPPGWNGAVDETGTIKLTRGEPA